MDFPKNGSFRRSFTIGIKFIIFSILTNHFFREINVDSCYHKFCYTSIEQTRYHHSIKDISVHE